MRKDHAKKTSEAGKTLSSAVRGKLQKTVVLSETGRPKMISEIGRFPAKMGGLESLHKYCWICNTVNPICDIQVIS